eukprot:s698_g4.t1
MLKTGAIFLHTSHMMPTAGDDPRVSAAVEIEHWATSPGAVLGAFLAWDFSTSCIPHNWQFYSASLRPGPEQAFLNFDICARPGPVQALLQSWFPALRRPWWEPDLAPEQATCASLC